MKIEVFEFNLAIPENFKVPRFAGSMLRGAFGHAFRQLTCMTNQPTCHGCSLVNTCSYTKVFEVQAQTNQSQRNTPSPYIIQPQQTSQLKTGERFYQFSMTLIGDTAIAQLPIIIYAWQQALQRGLSKERISIELISVNHTASKTQVYTAETQSIQTFPQQTWLPPALPSGQIKVKLCSPLRLQVNKKLIGQREFNVPTFFKAVIRRNRSMLNHVCTAEEQSTYNDFIALDNLESITNHDIDVTLNWLNWSRYSSRQQQKMDLGGLVGEFTLPAGLLNQAQWQALSLAQKLNIGKHTVFGMGQLKMYY